MDSKVSGCTTNQHLLDYIQEGLKVFDLSKMIQLSMDGPHMNLKLLWKMKEQTNLSMPNSLTLVPAIYTSLAMPLKAVLK